METKSAIGIFDSGYGGLTVFKEIRALLPKYNYIYLGDTARSPYGNRSFETVYQYTLECLEWFFKNNCPLVILACNTASAKALRNIQQKYLPFNAPAKRVLGVIRPTTEVIGNYTKTNQIGILGTKGTISSGSYVIEINKFFPEVNVHQVACPMWVPIIENGYYNYDEADFFIKERVDILLKMNNSIDTVLLACTHYPILIEKIKKFLPESTKIVAQGNIVATSLYTYLQKHPEIEAMIAKQGKIKIYTTDDTVDFNNHATLFFNDEVDSMKLHL